MFEIKYTSQGNKFYCIQTTGYHYQNGVPRAITLKTDKLADNASDNHNLILTCTGSKVT